MLNRLSIGMIVGLAVIGTSSLAQNSGHASHHAKQTAKGHSVAKSAMPMCACCSEGGMMGMGQMNMRKEPPKMSGGMGQGMGMGMDMDPKMMEHMHAQDQKIQDLVKDMNDASQDRKMDAAIAVINAMADQNAAMRKMMMEHMSKMGGMGAANKSGSAHGTHAPG